ncbi:MAG: hypothetical protein V4692_00960 [Bdellovibrionota bacterium]
MKGTIILGRLCFLLFAWPSFASSAPKLAIQQSKLSVGTSLGYHSTRFLNVDGRNSSFHGPLFGIDLNVVLTSNLGLRILGNHALGNSSGDGNLVSTGYGGGLRVTLFEGIYLYTTYLVFNQAISVNGIQTKFSHGALDFAASAELFNWEDLILGFYSSYGTGPVSKSENPALSGNSGFDRFQALATITWSPSSLSIASPQ